MNQRRSFNLFLVGIALCASFLFVEARGVNAYHASPRKQGRGKYQSWQHSASFFILTTAEGANLPESASENDFPLLVRLNRDTFDFSQARPQGEDIRFSTDDDTPLAYQIEEWNVAKGAASIWIRIPTIRGNTRQKIHIHWGKTDAVSESNGSAVFNESNGCVSVFHMDNPIQEEVGTLQSTDKQTTSSKGIVGSGRHFAGGQGVFGGDRIVNYPSEDSAHSSEAWFRAERPNVTVLGWGNEGGGRGSKVRMQLRSPLHLHIDSDFSDVAGKSKLSLSEWIHVVHTYQNGEGRVYVNGKLDGTAHPRMDIKRPSKMWIGGWYDYFDFVGDIDEVRISKVARSADWVRLEYENQKPLQTLVGTLVQEGDTFAVSQSEVTLLEGKSVTLSAKAGGALKVFWSLLEEGKQTLVEVDRLQFTLAAGRVKGDKSLSLQFKALYADGVKTKDIPITIKEAIPEPKFTLKAPTRWNGRDHLEVRPQIANLNELRDADALKLNFRWSISGVATIKAFAGERLTLERAQNSGKMTVTLALNNGGVETVHSTTVQVTEPKKDEWAQRTPLKDEKPQDNQFYARNDKNEGTLHYNGNLLQDKEGGAAPETADAVFLRLYAENTRIKTVVQRLPASKTYALSVKLKPGLIQYRVEFGAKYGKLEKVLRTVNNLVCGDAYLINGQSNAEATAWGEGDFPDTSNWVRSFGSAEGSPEGARLKLWGSAARRSPGGNLQIGYWGMELAKRLVENQKIPICVLNGAVGGTRIDQHQRNPKDPEDAETIYGRLLWRVQQARLTHGIRGVLWHQGENDQGADGPTGGYGWETYQEYFVEMSAAWKQNYPNIQHIYLFQIWPKSCGMGIEGSDNRLREVQRRLPALYSKMSVMSTLGIKPPGGCHYPPEGYAEFARLICPLVERDNYAQVSVQPVTAPNLKTVYYIGTKRDEIALVFDQPMAWSDKLTSQFYLEGVSGNIVSGAASGKVITLKLKTPSLAKHLTYLDSKSWSEENLLYGQNGIAALTFCEVPILSGR